MKYIDSEKLIAEIERRKNKSERRLDNVLPLKQKDTIDGEQLAKIELRDKVDNAYLNGVLVTLSDILSFIASLQQEQHLTIEKVVEQCKRFGGNPEVIQQEQPEVDLEEEAYMRGFAQGAKEERERVLEDITKMRDTAEKRGLNFGAECGFQIALDELEQILTGKLARKEGNK